MARYINNGQKALFHLAAAQVGMDEAEKRDLLRDVAGIDSLKSVTLEKFRDVMDELKRRGFVKKPGKGDNTAFTRSFVKWKKAVGARPGMATPEQLARIETDWSGMRWYWASSGAGHPERSLRGFLKSQAEVSDLRFLSFDQAGNVIEALKAIAHRTPDGVEKEAEARRRP